MRCAATFLSQHGRCDSDGCHVNVLHGNHGKVLGTIPDLEPAAGCGRTRDQIAQLIRIKGTLNERICLRWLATARADGMRRFRVVIGLNLNKAVSSNVPGRSYIDKRGIVRAAWHYSTAKRARPCVADTGDSHR